MTTFFHILATFTIITFISLPPSLSQTPCKSKTFSNTTTTFTKCSNLPTLNATLHYTYNSSHSMLSMAFTATPPSAQGWVSWAINPKALAMLGSQALIAYKPTNGGPVSVNTYDIKAYSPILNGPISYHVSDLSAEESDGGEITIFATWTIPKGEVEINQVWQVGPVVQGKVGKHAIDKPNLNSVMKLSLVDGPVSAAPSASPFMVPAHVAGGGAPGATAPATTNGVVKGCGISSIMVFVFLGLFFLVNL